MDTIFHEKQEGSLCAQHCLNALLQGSYFTPVDLATLGQKMDDEERMRMAESGVDTDDYRRFLEQPSGNMDDSGYFSVQVINSALEVWGLELLPYSSTEPRAVMAQQQPIDMNAYICNYKDHWFTIRKLGHQWFNLNSLLNGPELISDTYLSMFLAQLQQEGYSIFVVFGSLPECTADKVLRVQPVEPAVRPRPLSDESELQRALRLSLSRDPEKPSTSDDPELEQALRLSLGKNPTSSPTPTTSSSDSDLEKAIQLSLERTQELKLEEEEEELRKALCLSLTGATSPNVSTEIVDITDDDNDSDSELERAIRLSLEATTPTIEDVNVAELRQRRIAYLENRIMPQGSNALHREEHCK